MRVLAELQKPPVLTAIMACAVGLSITPASIRAADVEFRVASHNIYVANADLAATADALRDTGADIICLQETTPSSEQFLRLHLDKYYPHIRFQVGRIGNGPALLSKFPIRLWQYHPSTAGINGTGYAIVDVRGRLVQVVNVHLNPVAWRRGGLAAVGQSLRETEDIHTREIADIFANVNPSSPTLIMGDFNSLPDSVAPRFLKDHGFIDSLGMVERVPDAFKTLHFRWRGTEFGVRIDYIFHTAHLATRESRVIRKGGSDHSIVTSLVRLAENPVTNKPNPNPRPVSRDRSKQ